MSVPPGKSLPSPVSWQRAEQIGSFVTVLSAESPAEGRCLGNTWNCDNCERWASGKENMESMEKIWKPWTKERGTRH